MAKYKHKMDHKLEHTLSLKTIQIQKYVMKCSPKDLDTLGKYDEFELDNPEETNTIENDSETYDYDNDYTTSNNDPIANHITEGDKKDELIEGPVINLNNYYVITVIKSARNKYNCYFDPVALETINFKDKEVKHWADNILSFMILLANWTNEKQQKFLARPKPENFIFDGKITQKELIKQVYNGKGINTVNKITKENFSDLKNKILLLWDNKNMPLQNIFSKEFAID